MRFIGVEVEQETSAPPPKKNPGSAPVTCDPTDEIILVCLMKRSTFGLSPSIA